MSPSLVGTLRVNGCNVVGLRDWIALGDWKSGEVYQAWDPSRVKDQAPCLRYVLAELTTLSGGLWTGKAWARVLRKAC
jgi:hypothetical protein